MYLFITWDEILLVIIISFLDDNAVYTVNGFELSIKENSVFILVTTLLLLYTGSRNNKNYSTSFSKSVFYLNSLTSYCLLTILLVILIDWSLEGAIVVDKVFKSLTVDSRYKLWDLLI